MQKPRDRQDRVRFVRRIIDAALDAAPDDVCCDPNVLFGGRGPHPFSRRFVRAVREAGFDVRTTARIGTKRVQSITQRLDLEDLIDMALIAAGRQAVAQMLINDQARDRMAERLCDTLSRRIVLVKRSDPR
jgi:hypothetical protein